MNQRGWSGPVRLVLTGLFLAGLVAYNPSELVSRLGALSLPELALSLGMVFPLLLVKAIRWRVLLAGMGQPIRALAAVMGYALGMGAGTLTPGQLGDFSKAWYVKTHGVPLRFGLVSSLFDRLFDIALLVMLVAWVGLVWGTGRNLLSSLALLPVLLAGGTVLVRGPIQRWAMGLAFRAISRSPFVRHQTLSETDALQLAVAPGAVLWAGLLTVLAYGVSVFRIQLLASSLGEGFDIFQTLVVATLASGANLVPITVAGVGTRDVALVLYLSSLGKAPGVALSLSALVLLLNLANLAVGALAAAWMPGQPGHEKTGNDV